MLEIYFIQNRYVIILTNWTYCIDLSIVTYLFVGPRKQLLLQVNGDAGTGKTRIIH